MTHQLEPSCLFPTKKKTVTWQQVQSPEEVNLTHSFIISKHHFRNFSDI